MEHICYLTIACNIWVRALERIHNKYIMYTDEMYMMLFIRGGSYLGTGLKCTNDTMHE
jgi:hypothetical protein